MAQITADAKPTSLAERHLQGTFGPVKKWPVLAVNAATLPDGRVITWSSHDNQSASLAPINSPENTFTYVDIWDPRTNTHKRVDNTQTNLFCAGQSFLPDGKLFAAGGHDGAQDNHYIGKPDANIFDWTADRWVRVANMSQRRWYPSTIGMPNGEQFVIGGAEITDVKQAHIAEVFQTNNKWRLLTGVDTGSILDALGLPGFIHSYPYTHIVPKTGMILVTGASPFMVYIDPAGSGTMRWKDLKRPDGNYRQKAYSVQYRPNKILLGGGTGPTGTALASTVIIDLSQAPDFPVEPGSDMHFQRTFANATLLPDGKLFVNGGNTSGITYDDETAIYSSEIWDPVANKWSAGAVAAVPRTYHSTAVLLADGRVLTMSGGLCGSCVGTHGANHLDAEFYHPPYFFKQDGSGKRAVRPTIADVPDNIGYGQQFSIKSFNAGSIAKVSLIALSSTTHGFNMGQRFMWLKILRRTADTLLLVAPKNSFIAPPGYYWLFLLDDNGVPSPGASVRIGA